MEMTTCMMEQDAVSLVSLPIYELNYDVYSQIRRRTHKEEAYRLGCHNTRIMWVFDIFNNKSIFEPVELREGEEIQKDNVLLV